MKQIFKSNSGIGVFDVPMPSCGDMEILVAVQVSAISTGTETMDMKPFGNFSEKLEEKKRLANKLLEFYKEKGLGTTLELVRKKLSPSEQALFYSPIGYSNAGVVVKKGRLVTGFNVGDRVACAGSGIAAHAEYVSVPVNLAVKVPDNVAFKDAAFTTIGSIAMHGIRRSEVSFGESIVIVGLGLIGLIAVQIAKAWGLVVIGIDLNTERLELAKKLGADYCFNANDPGYPGVISQLTNGNGVDAVIVYAATKSSEPVNQAFKLCRRKGKVVAVGAVGMNLERDEMYMKEIDLIMSTSYGPGRYDKNYEIKGLDYPIGYVRWTENRNMSEFVRLLGEKKIQLEPLISNEYGINQALEAYKSLVDNPLNNIANIFLYEQGENLIPVNKIYFKDIKSVPGKIRVGIIGAGSFIQTNHLANLLKLPDKYELIAIANGTPGSAKAVGEKYKCSYITTEYAELLNDPNIDAIIIGTRHNLHAKQVIDSINAGKHVLVEKPLALTLNEITEILAAYEKTPNLIVTVGFNRRYAPFIQRIKSIIDNCNEPVVMNYRVNAGFFPPEFWAQTPEEGGGRIIGEVCHFVDLLSYLAGSEIEKMYSTIVPINGKSIKSQDNLSVSLSFKNGSIASLTYTSLGGKSMEKEKLEVFVNGKSYIVNDFYEFLTFDGPETNEKLKEKDKGHFRLMTEFAKQINGESSLLMPFEHDIRISELMIECVNDINSI